MADSYIFDLGAFQTRLVPGVGPNHDAMSLDEDTNGELDPLPCILKFVAGWGTAASRPSLGPRALASSGVPRSA